MACIAIGYLLLSKAIITMITKTLVNQDRVWKCLLTWCFYSNWDNYHKNTCQSLTGGIFETGAYRVPSKSQNSTVLCQGGPSSSNKCSNPSWAWRRCHPFGTNHYPPFQPTIKNQVFSLALDILFFSKIRLEIYIK